MDRFFFVLLQNGLRCLLLTDLDTLPHIRALFRLRLTENENALMSDCPGGWEVGDGFGREILHFTRSGLLWCFTRLGRDAVKLGPWQRDSDIAHSGGRNGHFKWGLYREDGA